MKETGTLDKLYLEWSQFTTAITGKELTLMKERGGDVMEEIE